MYVYCFYLSFPGGSVVKSLPAEQKMWVQSMGQENPWRRKWQSTPVFLPRKPHGQRSLMGYRLWGLQRVAHDLATITRFYLETSIAPV